MENNAIGFNLVTENPERTAKLMREFTDLCKPLNEWLQDNFDLHTSIILEVGYAKIVQDQMGVPLEVRD